MRYYAQCIKCKNGIKVYWKRISGSFSNDNTTFPQFTYEYMNQPKNHAPESMNIHYGMASIWIDAKTLKGEFFNGRGRNNFGYFTESD